MAFFNFFSKKIQKTLASSKKVRNFATAKRKR
jgi:hypothetical protein